MDTKSVLGVATNGAGWMLFSSLMKKIITFSLKQILIQRSNPALIGTAEIQLELLLSSMLFLSRESIRVALMRLDATTSTNFQKLINLSWFPALILLFVCIYVMVMLQNTWSNSVEPIVVKYYCLGALLEACGEPLHNAYRNSLCISPGLNADTVAIFLSCVTTVICVSYMDLGIVGYGIAQVVHGLSDLIILILYVYCTPIHGKIRTLSDFLPRFVLFPLNSSSSSSSADSSGNTVNNKNKNSEHWVMTSIRYNFDVNSLYLMLSSFSTCVLKHLLTQTDKIILSVTASNYNQVCMMYDV